MENSPISIFSASRGDLDQAFFAFRSGDNSPELALKLRKLAVAGHLEAYLYLGCMYEDGSNGLAKDLHEALKFYEIAADAGFDEGLLAVAKFNLLGLAGRKNEELALAQYLQLANKEDFSPVACYRVGRIYHSGEIVDRQLEIAAAYYRKASRMGNLPAMSFLARLEFRRGHVLSWARTYVQSVFLAFKLHRLGARSSGLRQW